MEHQELIDDLKKRIEDYFDEKEHEILLEDIKNRVEIYLRRKDTKNNPQIKYPLMGPSYDQMEIAQVMDSLLKRDITMNFNNGNKVGIFEDLWKGYVGKKEGIMVNSGSSANLMALRILCNPIIKNPIMPGSEIITPALTWTTTVSPIWSVGCKPVFVDVDINSFTIDPNEIEKAITSKTRAIMVVHLLGHPCDMDRIMEIAKKHNLYLIEDCCEAHGAEYKGRIVGSFGDVSTFSFFFSHHLSTMEGGMVLTDNEEYAEIARTMRSKGVIRNCRNEEFKNRYYNNPKYQTIDRKYLFVNIGYNLRPTELNGGFGIEQFKKFPEILRIRRENALIFLERLKKYSDFIQMQKVGNGINHALFGFAIYVK